MRKDSVLLWFKWGRCGSGGSRWEQASRSYMIKAALGFGKRLVPWWEVIFSPDAWWARWSCGSDARHSYDGSQRWGCKSGVYLNHVFTIVWGYPKTIGNGRGPVHLSQGKWTLTLHVFIKSCPESFWEIRVIPIEARCQDITGLSLFLGWEHQNMFC